MLTAGPATLFRRDREVKLALVLGAGGLVGIAHHVGVACALLDELGFEESKADLVVGTSAGSAVAAYLRSGWTPHELLARATDLRDAAPGPLSGGTMQLVRHGIGSAYVVARATVRVPSLLSLPSVPLLRRAFPAGIATMGNGPDILERELPRSWPERRLWLATYDLVGRRRVVLGRPGEPYVPLPSAVRASCAIPGLYPPVKIGRRIYVDGGAYSPTNLDLATKANCDFVICISPMSHAPGPLVGPHWRLLRALPSLALRKEAEIARKAGVKVALVAPAVAELRAQGLNPMRATGLDAVVDAAYEATARMIDRGGLGPLLDEYAA